MAIELVHDVMAGDYLPEYGATVRDTQVSVDNPREETVEITLCDGRTVLLPGHDDIAIE
ncbi:hypothetical protein [Mycolicibacterium sphagni]|uniref:hypothetical protein n=1 Tax=Mycolicibacterium sphagni TaxID=1786 RepID=UPI001576D54E|nr:hypothetical protein [Mycolicibacterium sphagni]